MTTAQCSVVPLCASCRPCVRQSKSVLVECKTHERARASAVDEAAVGPERVEVVRGVEGHPLAHEEKAEARPARVRREGVSAAGSTRAVRPRPRSAHASSTSPLTHRARHARPQRIHPCAQANKEHAQKTKQAPAQKASPTHHNKRLLIDTRKVATDTGTETSPTQTPRMKNTNNDTTTHH